MTDTATLVATLTGPPEPELLARVAVESEWLEVRADLVGEVDVEALRRDYPGRLLFTLRSREEGGAAREEGEDRRARLAEAAAAYDLVDLEAARDLDDGLLDAVPAEKRILSWHGTASLTALAQRFRGMAEVDARFYKLVPSARQPGDELAPLALLHALGRRDVIAFAGGRQGTWSRLIAPRLGAPVVYGAATSDPAAPGQLSVATLRRDYGLPHLAPAEAVFGVVGRPVFHSLSPRLHNAAYRELGLPYHYLAFEPTSFGDFWLEVVESGAPGSYGIPLRGLSITAPFKEVASVVAGAASPLVQRLEAANTLVDAAGVWEAEVTDPEGVVRAIREAGAEVRGRRAAVVGCGGAGRGAAAGLDLAGANVVLFNRSEERGREAGLRLRLPYRPLEALDPSAFDLLVNATSLGHETDDPLPFDLGGIVPGTVVVDMVYGPEPTPLLKAAADAGATPVDGRSVLLFQAVSQFRMMTGRELPLASGRSILGLPPGPAERG